MQPLFNSPGGLWTGLAAGLLPALLFSARPLQAQTPAADDFNPGEDSSVLAIACDADGNFLVGGAFEQMGGRDRYHIARLFPNGTVDPTFAPRMDGFVNVLALQPDGRILAGGDFSQIGSHFRAGLGRLHPDGTVDLTFDAEVAGGIRSLALQPDGKILVGGKFAAVGGAPRQNLGRLNPDGTLDVTFAGEANGPVTALLRQADGKFLVGGEFTMLSGQPRPWLGRLLADGTVDPGFNVTVDTTKGSGVLVLALQPDGKVLVGGDFREFGGERHENLVRLQPDGTVDSDFHASTDGLVSALALQADGKILLGGIFLSVGMEPIVGLGRLNPDGSVDAAFNPQAGFMVSALLVQPDGKTLVGGELSMLGGQPRQGIGRLNATGPVTEVVSYADSTLTWRRGGPGPEVWRTTFEYSTDGVEWTVLGEGNRISDGWELGGVSLPEGVTVQVRGETGSGCVARAWFGPLFLLSAPTPQTADFGGAVHFQVVAGGSEPRMYQWYREGESLTDNADFAGTATPTLTLPRVSGALAGNYQVAISNAQGSITSPPVLLTVNDPLITQQPRDQTVVPGETATFSVAATGSDPLAYQWQRDGEPLANGGRVSGATSPALTITNITSEDDGIYQVVVSNEYGNTTSEEAALTAATIKVDPEFQVAVESHQVEALALQPDGKIVVGGYFQYLAGQQVFGLGRLNPDGTLDASFAAAMNFGDWVLSVAVQPDGKIVIGGRFSVMGDRSLIRLHADGTPDEGFAGRANKWVYCMVVQPDGKILIGGNLTEVNGHSQPGLARLNADGALDASFVPALPAKPWMTHTIHAIALQPDGKILIGGQFGLEGYLVSIFLARLHPDGSLDRSFSPPIIDNWVETLAVQPDGKILIGGQFTTVNGQSRERLTRLNPDGSLDPDFPAAADKEVFSLALQTDGKIVVGGSFTTLNGEAHSYLGRLNADGSGDPSFSLGANNAVVAVALQADGGILAGGAFRTMGGVAHTRIARLLNTHPATQALEPGAAALFWRRSGAGPEVTTTWFDYSPDGSEWTPLGQGVRRTGGWELADVSWPEDAVLRVRGLAWGGRYNGSSSWVEDYYGRTVILDPPENLIAEAGATVTFRVRAGGSEPFTYQWRKDGVPLAEGENLAGVHTPVLTLSQVWGPARGAYSVVVSNALGTATSPTASLTVEGDPQVTRPPVSLLVNAGEAAEFTVEARGTEPLSYQWQQDGVELPDARGTTLTLTNVQPANAGAYTVVVSNAYGRVTSEPAGLEVNAVQLAPEFSGGVRGGIRSIVSALAVQPDGKVLLGGDFSSVAGERRWRIARTHADGSPDLDFAPSANDRVNALVVQSNGKILVGGKFTELNDQPRAHLGRWHSAGSVDEDFHAGTDGEVFSLALQADGKILVAGWFTALNDQPRRMIGRLNPDGTLDATFDPEADEPLFANNGGVACIAVQPDGKILLGGRFQTTDIPPRRNLVRLNPDGSLDESFTSELPPGGQLSALVLQPDGRILAGGSFGSWASTGPARVARLNADGSLDAEFTPHADGQVYSLVLQTDGRILIGGDFYFPNGASMRNLARLMPDGRWDPHFHPQVVGTVFAVALKSNGNLLLGGKFDHINGEPRQSLACLRNTAPATSTLHRTDTTLAWLRGGPAPEVWRTTFEHSADGVHWTFLGAGLRIPGGWEWSGTPIPESGYLRARGHLTGGGNNGSAWFVEDYLGAPLILAPPLPGQRKAGETIQLTVKAVGSPPLSYQWLWNGVPVANGEHLSGATTATLALTEVSGAQAGRYSVVVTNAEGSATSPEAKLDVVDPWIAVSPVNQDAVVGQSASFTVKVVGSEPLEYQWLKDGGEMPEGHDPVLKWANVQTEDAGYYQVRVRNVYGEALSDEALLAVNTALPDPGFQAAADGRVQTLVVQGDGKVLVGGNFAALNGAPRSGLGRLLSDGSVDETFSPEAQSGGYTLVQQPDGRLLVGGSFTSLNGSPRAYLGRLNPDGTVDLDFDPQVQGGVWLIALQSDGRILISGNFAAVQGELHQGIARLLPDGTVDSTFQTQVKQVASLIWQPDGQILLGGAFTVVNKEPRRFLARLNPDGSLDREFTPQANAFVSVLALQPDGKIVVAGGFAWLNGWPREQLGRLNPDGTLDQEFNPGANGGSINTVILQADGKLLLGGEFTRLGGMPRFRIGRLNPDGTLDPQFNPGANLLVGTLTLQPDGRILAGGNFTSLGGSRQERIARLLNPDLARQNARHDGTTLVWQRGGSTPEISFAVFEHSPDGEQWSALASPVRTPGGWTLRDVVLPQTERIRARGLVLCGPGNGSGWMVESYGGAPWLVAQPVHQTNQLATTATFQIEARGTEPLSYQWQKDGVDLPDAQGATLELSAVSPADAGEYRVVVSNAYGRATSEPALLVVDASPEIVTPPASQNTEPGEIIQFTVEATGTPPLSYQWQHNGEPLADDGRIAGATTATLTVGGVVPEDVGEYTALVSNASGNSTSEAALLSVNTVLVDAGFRPDASREVIALAVQPDGKIVVGGDITQLAGTPSHYLGRVNPDGTLDPSFSTTADATVRAVVRQPDGKLVIGGDFGSVNGQPRLRLARLHPDGSLDPDFDPAANESVYAVALQADGKLLVGGNFTMLGGVSRRYLARLNAAGSVDESFTVEADRTVLSLAPQPDGRILVGGQYSQLAGRERNRLARLLPDGTLEADFAPEVGSFYFAAVWTLLIQPDGKILAGGKHFGESPWDQNLIRFQPDGARDPSFAPVTGSDVYTLALQTDGDILLGGKFATLNGLPRRGIARLDAAGKVDLHFSPSLSGQVYSLALQGDGKILAGGSVYDAVAEKRVYLARLNNTLPATQRFTRDDSILTWRRGGASPEVWRTTFAHTADGTNWTLLGAGTRVDVGWEWVGDIPLESGTWRVQGWTTGGQDNASSGMVAAHLGAPVLLSQPASRTHNFAASAAFRASAGGTEPLTYQWYREGTPLADDDQVHGAQSAVLTVEALTGADAGHYTVQVSNPAGNVTSEAATLTVVDPLITTPPASQTWGLGQSATFHVAAVGTEPLHYQWWKDGEKIPGANAPTLELSPLREADAGQYEMVVSNGYGTTTSPEATLTLVRMPAILRQPQNQRAEPGQDMAFHVEVVGIEPLNYQWWKDGAALPGATGATLAVSDAQGADAGLYHVVVSNAAGETASDAVALMVNLAAPDLDFQPEASGTRFVSANALALQPDGLLVAGEFSSLGGQPRQSLGWIALDGRVTDRFANGVNISLRTLAAQPDGKVVVGGFFTELAGEARYEIGRLQSDGSLDTSFAASADSGVLVTLVQPDGKILLGGRFLKVNGEPRLHIARLNMNGALDPEFQLDRMSGDVLCLAFQPDGKILVGGNFRLIGDDAQAFLGRLNPDGLLDPTFAPQLDSGVGDLARLPNGDLLVVGAFKTVNGQPAEGIARLKPDGSLDASFAARLSGRGAYHLALQADGKILVGGDFTAVNGAPQWYVARLNPDGSLDFTFAPVVESWPLDRWLFSLALQADGRVLIGARCLMALPRPCTVLQRVFNPDPATQELSYDGSTLTWLRGGSSPEAWRVTFAHSTDGTDGTPLGEPVRIPGGWALTGVNLPDAGTIRARAYVRSGASSGFVETLLPLGEVSEIRLVAEAAGFGADGFGFPITGPAGQRVVVELSENLRDWVEVETLTLGAEPADFTDPDAPWDGQRYYRVRLIP